MSEDELLTALGRVAAEQSADREAWEKSAAPVNEASIDRMTKRVLAELGAPAQPPATVTPIRRRRLAWAGVAALPLAAAAAIALFVARPSGDGDLPGYSFSIAGGVRDDRGADTRPATAPIAVAPRTQVVLLARPDARASGEVHASTFLLRSGAPVPVPSTSEASDKGALRVTVQGDDLTKAAGASGIYQLVLVVGRSTEVDRRAFAASDDTKHGDWVRFVAPVRVTEADH